MSGPTSKPAPDITCPVCHSVNPSTRTFCWKCAADLHAPVPDPTAAPAQPKVIVPIQPLLIGGGVALAAIALIAIVAVLLGGSPAATTAPSLGPTPAASTDASSGAAGSSGAPTLVAPTSVAPTEPPPTEAPPATPKITPIPAPAIVVFTGPTEVDCSQPDYTGFITLSWLIENADSTTLSIDGPGVYSAYPNARASVLVPFSCGNVQHTYTLTTVGGHGPAATRTLTIVENSGV